MTALFGYDAIDALNFSSLKWIHTSPKMLRHRAEQPREDTYALARGRSIHVATLEPDKWARDYMIAPEWELGDKPTKPSKPNARSTPKYIEAFPDRMEDYELKMAARDAPRLQWLADHAHITLLSAEEHALAERCARAVREHKRPPGRTDAQPLWAADLLRGGRAEEVIRWTDPDTGLPCKGRVDYITPQWFADLKSGRRESLKDIFGDSARLLYNCQLSWYYDGAIEAGVLPRTPDHLPYLIYVQTSEPFDVAPLRLPHDALERGRDLCRSWKRRYAACVAADYWPGIAPELTDLILPNWAPSAPEESEEF